jgi:type IV pilus assembly protein PilQ
MILNLKNILIFSLIFSLVSCSALVKDDVNGNSKKYQDHVQDLKNKESIDETSLAKFDNYYEENSALRKIIEIKSKQRGIKLSDPSWVDYPVTIDLNAVPLRSLFELLSKLTKINFIVGEEVKGDITINVKDVNWIETLDMVLREKNLISEVNKSGNVILIHSFDLATSQSDSLQKTLTAKGNAARAYAGLEAKSTAIIKLNYTKPDVLAQQMKDIIASLETANSGGQAQGIANSRASFVIDARTNSIIIQATNSDMEWIKSAVIGLDRPTKQVLVEVFIVDATDNFQRELGSRVGLFNKGNTSAFQNASVSGTMNGTSTAATNAISSGTGTNMALNSLNGTVADNSIAAAKGSLALLLSSSKTDIRLELQAMQDENLIKIVSNPKLFIIDNEQATITDGQEVPYFSQAQAGATPSVSFKNASLQLQVKPSIIDDGNIYLDLVINNDVPLKGSSPPPISKKELKTKLLVKDGGIAMIGGINKINDVTDESGIPLLANIPLLGSLFKSSFNQKNKSQLYIFISPKVL